MTRKDVRRGSGTNKRRRGRGKRIGPAIGWAVVFATMVAFLAVGGFRLLMSMRGAG